MKTNGLELRNIQIRKSKSEERSPNSRRREKKNTARRSTESSVTGAVRLRGPSRRGVRWVVNEWGLGNTGEERYRVERRISSRQRRHQDGETQQRSDSSPGSSSTFRGVERSSYDRRDACRKLLESDVECRPPMSATKGFRGGGTRLRYARFARRYRTPEPSPAALAFSTWVTAVADPEGSRPRAKAPSYYNKGRTGFRRNAGFRMFSDSQEWLGRY